MKRDDPHTPDLIAALTAIQAKEGRISAAALREVSERERVPLYHLHGLVTFYPHLHAEPLPGVEVAVCTDLACHLRGAAGLLTDLAKTLAGTPTEVRACSCLGLCERAPAVMVGHEPVAPAAVAGVVEAASGEEDRVRVGDEGGPLTPTLSLARSLTQIDPYPAERYAALRSMEGDEAAEAVIAALKTAGLRGMGGAGFPTGAKWQMVREAVGAPKYVVCNADESEPGTFKDRQILEEAPHLVLEGMGLAARILGTTEAILFLRHEYGRARAAVERELPAYHQVPGAVPLRVFLSPGAISAARRRRCWRRWRAAAPSRATNPPSPARTVSTAAPPSSTTSRRLPGCRRSWRAAAIGSATRG